MRKVTVIAEAGVNHNGDIEIAKKLIDVASEAGADYIKFQTFKAEKLVSKYAEKAEYQKQTTSAEESQYNMIKKLELDDEMHRKLISYCKEKDIAFLSTPFDEESAVMLSELGIEIMKIPSGEVTNLPFLESIGSLNKEVILSTGMSSLGEVEFAIDTLRKSGSEKITVLHCNTEYPTPMEDVNLMAMVTMRDAFKLEVGYSDHTIGIEIPIAAVALGASIVEKHFTLDRNMEGPDHKASLEPSELKEMIRSIRNIEKALGDGIKKPTESEKKNIAIARKSIVAKTAIGIGDILSEENICIKRPGTGISPNRWYEVLGERAKRNYKKDELID